jgi:Raf kinase inhibitor-like YbhB/YbcL family protein
MQDVNLSSSPTTSIRYTTLRIRSRAFSENGQIPPDFTCDGENINPPLQVDGSLEEAQSLAIVVDDPDAPVGNWTHWLIWNIPVTHFIRSNHPQGEEGLNDFLHNQYDGPCPANGRHHYRFKVYALDCILNLNGTTRQRDLEKAMAGHILGFGELVGTYQRKSTNN